MTIFKKRGPEVIDLTELQKKGTLQRSQKIAKINTRTLQSSDVVDLTSVLPRQISHETSSSPLGDFLSNPTEQTIKTSQSISSIADTNAFKIKLEDLEFKLDNLISRLQKIEEKLEKFKD